MALDETSAAGWEVLTVSPIGGLVKGKTAVEKICGDGAYRASRLHNAAKPQPKLRGLSSPRSRPRRATEISRGQRPRTLGSETARPGRAPEAPALVGAQRTAEVVVPRGIAANQSGADFPVRVPGPGGATVFSRGGNAPGLSAAKRRALEGRRKLRLLSARKEPRK
jgi:hypothetical protein